jgi:hypothetical protein
MVTEVVGSRIDVIETASPGFSLYAIIGGALVITAVAFILTVLGAGFGLASVSPWPSAGATATRVAVVGGIWLIIVQWASAGIGGYVAGRLGPRITVLHLDEVYFRDTARGVIAWALAMTVTVLFLTSAVASLVGGAAHGAANIVASVGQGAAQGATQNNSDAPAGYLIDTLFRKSSPDANTTPQDARGEATRIIAAGLLNGDIPAGDKTYLAQLVAARTGLSQDDAQKRVDGVIAQAKQAEVKVRQDAEVARKAARDVAFFTAFSLLIGAFVAGVAAKIGGHHRDELEAL